MMGVILGGDARFCHLARKLLDAGYDVRTAGLPCCPGMELPRAEEEDVRRADWCVARSPGDGALLKLLPEGVRVIGCGPARMGSATYDLTRDEDFLLQNAYLTAEAAVVRMAAGGKALTGARVAVVGVGRIGRQLIGILRAMGAEVLAASTSIEKRAEARLMGCRTIDTGNLALALPQVDYLFSTPAHPVLGREELAACRPGVRIMDLASPPYGVDLAAAAELGLDAVREGSLPGRYCPESAGEVLFRKISAILRRWS